MIQKVEMYQAVCDGCGRELEDKKGFFTLNAKTEKEAIYLATLAFDWLIIDGKLYCPDCVEYDEETDSYKPKKKKQ